VTHLINLHQQRNVSVFFPPFPFLLLIFCSISMSCQSFWDCDVRTREWHSLLREVPQRDRKKAINQLTGVSHATLGFSLCHVVHGMCKEEAVKCLLSSWEMIWSHFCSRDNAWSHRKKRARWPAFSSFFCKLAMLKTVSEAGCSKKQSTKHTKQLHKHKMQGHHYVALQDLSTGIWLFKKLVVFVCIFSSELTPSQQRRQKTTTTRNRSVWLLRIILVSGVGSVNEFRILTAFDPLRLRQVASASINASWRSQKWAYSHQFFAWCSPVKCSTNSIVGYGKDMARMLK